MPNNINTLNTNSTVILNKISELSNRLKIISQTPTIGQTQEELIIEANSMLNTLFQNIAGPIFNPLTVTPNIKPDPTDFNTNLSAILSDLTVLFAELQNVGNVELSNFNFMISNSNRLIAKLKSCFSKLGDYILYSQDPSKDSLFFSDTFNNLSRIDFNSKLISSTQCNVNQSQGLITLPIDTAAIKPIILTITPTINSNSNGTAGNNVQTGAALNNDINAILDNNPDTWFEYENVVLNKSEIVEPLILDITLNLGNSQIINTVTINPNNFGTKNNIIIDSIETSEDGKLFINIKKDIPSSGFENSTSDDTAFIISSDSSKFTGQASYTFLPRPAKFLHLVFRQTTPYTILDKTNTPRDRYAIGIRDISVAAIPYINQGELISTSFVSDNELKKIVLNTSQFPNTDSSLLTIQHYVSPDDGLTWNNINPDNFTNADPSISSLLNFNTLDNDSINTASPVLNLRYKAVLKRNDDGFNNPSATITNQTINNTELRSVPTSSPFDILLNNTPIQNSIKLIDPTFGSRGLVNKRYTFGLGTGDAISFILPFAPITKDKAKITDGPSTTFIEVPPEQIRVNGQLWTSGNLDTSGPTTEVYEINYASGEITFGDNIHGKAVPSGAPIDIIFETERLKVSGDINHIAKLDYSSSNDKQTFSIKRYGKSNVTSELLKKGTNVNILINKNIDLNQGLTFSDTTVFFLFQAFINGSKELHVAGDYSVDINNGVIYSYSPASTVADTTIQYGYIDVKTLDNSEWDFTDNTYTSINIHDDAFLSIKQSEALPAAAKYAALSQFSLVQGSVQFSGSDLTALQKEVPYVNGHIELIQGIQTTESIGSLNPGFNHYVIRMPISLSVDFRVTFSNTDIFSSLQTAPHLVTSAGKYYVDRIAKLVSVFVDTAIADAGTMNYYYDDLMKSNSGLYSINYATGELFTASPIANNTIITYNYSNFTADYNISRVVDPKDFSYDSSTNTITISEREILKRANLTSKNSTQSNYYEILYNMIVDNGAELKLLAPYFSPLLCDYALKCIPESSLVF